MTRRVLFTEGNVIGHVISSDRSDASTTRDWRAKLAHYSELAAATSSATSENVKPMHCKEQLYIEPLDWLTDTLLDLNGKVRAYLIFKSKIKTIIYCQYLLLILLFIYLRSIAPNVFPRSARSTGVVPSVRAAAGWCLPFTFRSLK